MKIATKVFCLAAAIALAGCGPSKEDRAAAFMQRCLAATFTDGQCALLLAMKGEAEDDANNAAAVGIAMGSAAIATSGGRR